MNHFILKIDQIIEERSLLEHPFYQTWSEGKLTHDALAGYSKEYFQLVKAVPKFMNQLLESAPESIYDELDYNRVEEINHIDLWIKFANELGISYNELINYTGTEKTNKAVSTLNSLMSSFESGAAAMYAFEKEIPKISQIKLDGLAEFYGITSEDATEYFREHTEADIRHTQSWQKILEESSGHDQDIMNSAKISVDAQNLLLDSCYEEYC